MGFLAQAHNLFIIRAVLHRHWNALATLIDCMIVFANETMQVHWVP
jgi:hypothetical protein